MSKCTTHNNINISSSTNIVDDVSNNIEELTTADDGDATSTEHTKTDNTSSNNNDNVDQNIVQENIGSNLEVSDICANCGKEDASNVCNKCKMLKYCNAACKKKHKSKHKKACERRVAELRDIELFKEPPPDEDCPICFLRLPRLKSGWRYQSCCGKVICSGCIHAPVYDDKGNAMNNKICAFCRTPTPASDKEIMQNFMERVEVDDAQAMSNLGTLYSLGSHGLPQDITKAFELWERAAELGYVPAYQCIGNAYLEIDMKEAVYNWELAAMRGDSVARHNLGLYEHKAGNVERALKHYLMSVKGGSSGSLKNIKDLYSKGKATKDEYAKALRSYQAYLSEVKSSQRDEAAAAREDYKYFE